MLQGTLCSLATEHVGYSSYILCEKVRPTINSMFFLYFVIFLLPLQLI